MPIPVAAGLAVKTLLSTAATTAVRNAPKLINPLAQQATRAASQMPLGAAARQAIPGGINQLRSNLLPALKQSAVEHGKQALIDGTLSALQQSSTQAPVQQGPTGAPNWAALATSIRNQPAQTPPTAGPIAHNGEVPR